MASHYVPTEYFADVYAERNPEAVADLQHFSEDDFDTLSKTLAKIETTAEPTLSPSLVARLGTAASHTLSALGSPGRRSENGPCWHQKPRKQAIRALHAVINTVDEAQFEVLTQAGTLYSVTSKAQNNGRDILIRRHEGYCEIPTDSDNIASHDYTRFMLRQQGSRFSLGYLERLGRPSPSEILQIAEDIREQTDQNG